MSKFCEISGVGPFSGNNVSHSNVKTRKRWLPNIKNKKYFVPELSQHLVLSLSARTIRSIDKQGGITNALLKAKEVNLSPRLQKIRTQITKKRKSLTKVTPKPATPVKAN